MVNVRLASDHQYGKLLFTWLSLVISLMVSFLLSFSHETSWMRYGTELSQFVRIFPSTLSWKVCFGSSRQGRKQCCWFDGYTTFLLESRNLAVLRVGKKTLRS